MLLRGQTGCIGCFLGRKSPPFFCRRVSRSPFHSSVTHALNNRLAACTLVSSHTVRWQTSGAAADGDGLTMLWLHMKRLFSFWQQGLVASIGAVMGIGVIIYLFSTPMKEDTVHHTAAMASEALQDPKLQQRAIELSKLVVRDVLTDPRSLDLTVKLVVELLAKEEVKASISSLLLSLFEDRYTQEITKKFILALLRDPWVSEQLDEIAKKQIHLLLENEGVKQAFTAYITKAATQTLEKPEIHAQSAQAIVSTAKSMVTSFIPFKAGRQSASSEVCNMDAK